MRLLHTADWHLGDRLGSRGVDRTGDLNAALQRIADLCLTEQVDALLVAGDLFSDKMGLQKDLSEVVRQLGDIFGPFLRSGGTILAVTGNHDREIPSQTLRNALVLADPTPLDPGASIQRGRLYLANRPALLRLADRQGTQVQFLLMPYPTPARYFESSADFGANREERHRNLHAAFTSRLQALRLAEGFQRELPTVLVAHLHLHDELPRGLFRLALEQDVVFEADDLGSGFAYVALGHIHQAGTIAGQSHVRYSGSVERMDLGERNDQKSVVLVDVGPEGLAAPPRLVPLPATPIYDVIIDNPAEQMPRLAEDFPDAESALVRYKLLWTPGEDDREALVKQLDGIFPRWYDREIIEVGARRPDASASSVPEDTGDVRAVVRHFVEHEAAGDPNRAALLELAEELLRASS